MTVISYDRELLPAFHQSVAGQRALSVLGPTDIINVADESEADAISGPRSRYLALAFALSPVNAAAPSLL